MLTPEWQLAHDKVKLARRREQITAHQATYCLGANTPRMAISRLHGFQRNLFAEMMQQPQFRTPPTPKPPVMNRTLGIIVGIIVGVIACGFIGCGIGALLHNPSLGAGIGSAVGLIPGYALGRHLTSPKA